MYFHMNYEAFFGEQVGVHHGEFSDDSCIYHGFFLLCIRIIQIINALVLIAMASRTTREKALMD